MTDRGRRSGVTDRSVAVRGMGDRGVSDAIGFVLIFGLIITSIGVVYVAGFQSLDAAREAERMSNAERAFDVLDDNLEDIVLRSAPSRATEVRLSEAALTVGDPVTINVTVEQSSDASNRLSRQVTAEPLVFRASDSNAVLYSLGTTFRQSNSGTVMTNPPEMVLGDDQMYIPLVRTSVGEDASIAGSTTVLVRSELVTQTVLVSNVTRKSDVTLNITSPRADAWREYIRRNSGATCDPAVNTPTFVSCEFTGIPRVVVAYVSIQVSYVQ